MIKNGNFMLKIDNYIDNYGRIHKKKDKLSNNGWIYSAVAIKLGYKLNLNLNAAQDCLNQLERHPYSTTKPPISRDEILGLHYILKPKKVSMSFIPKSMKKPKFNFMQFFKQLKELIKNKDDRNYFWQNELDQMYTIAFTVPLTDRHFLLKQAGKYNLIYHFIHIIDQLLPTKNRSERMIKWLKGKKDSGAVCNYFGKNHILCNNK